MARTLADVKKTHGPRDYAAEFRKALAGIPKGHYESTQELSTRAGIAAKFLAPLYEKFDAHRVTVKGASGVPAYLWARTPADAKKLRDALKSQNG